MNIEWGDNELKKKLEKKQWGESLVFIPLHNALVGKLRINSNALEISSNQSEFCLAYKVELIM